MYTRRQVAAEKGIVEASPALAIVASFPYINSHTLCLRLTAAKLSSWTVDIYTFLQTTTVTFYQIATTIGCHNHASYAIPTARAFLSHLCQAERQGARHHKSKITITKSPHE